MFGDYVGDVDPASNAYAWVGMRVGVMESLFKLDDGMNVQKNLVDDYSVSEDGLVWTLKLRDGVLFQSGNPMDAEAVKASLERTCSMQSRADGELGIASMEADGNVLTITTKKPNPILPNCLCDPYSGIVDVKSVGDDGDATIGTGPFKLVEYVENERMELDAFDDYWAGKPASKHVTIVPSAIWMRPAWHCRIRSWMPAMAFPMMQETSLTERPALRFHRRQPEEFTRYYFNLEHAFTGDPNFRKAVCMAIDKPSYAQVLVNGAGTPAKSSFPATHSRCGGNRCIFCTGV